MLFSTPTIASDGGQDQFYIDLSQCASLMNRRFYRQGINWAVSSIRLMTTGFEGQVTISKLPNSWVMSNAWEKGFRAWQHMIKNATDEAGNESIKGKFLDFKIYADRQHHQDGFGANLRPDDAEGNTANLGQWQPSEIEVPSASGSAASTTWELIAVGASNPGVGSSGYDAKSLIAGYEVSRALPYSEDPNSPADSNSLGENWIMSLFTEGTQQDPDVIEMLEVTGDKAPYPFEGDGTNTDTMYPGGAINLPALQVHSYEYITGTTVGGQTVARGGNFPCGLIKFDCLNTGSRTANIAIVVELVPGNHRGYLCEPMTEM